MIRTSQQYTGRWEKKVSSGGGGECNKLGPGDLEAYHLFEKRTANILATGLSKVKGRKGSFYG